MALRTISNLIKKYKTFGYVTNHPRPGTDHKTAPRIERQTVKFCFLNLISSSNVSNLFKKELGIQMIPFTIQN